jgi:hypothetical protein
MERRLHGDFSASETTLNTNSTIGEVTFVMDGIPYLNKIQGVADATINANLDKMEFAFKESNLQLNDLRHLLMVLLLWWVRIMKIWSSILS